MSDKMGLTEAITAILEKDVKALRRIRSNSINVLRLIRNFSRVGYFYILYRGMKNGNFNSFPAAGAINSHQQNSGVSVDTGLVPTGTPTKRINIVEHATLFDDESVREKLESMSKWDVMFGDSRNTTMTDMDESVNGFLKLGKTYKITLSIEEEASGPSN